MNQIKRMIPKPIRQLLSNKLGTIGISILIVLIFISVFAPSLAPHKHNRRSGRPHMEPSGEHIMGTTRMGKDVYSQLLYGGRISLTVGFLAGILTTIIAVGIGIAAGYLGGKIDEMLMLFTNIMLVIPGLPLLIVISSFFEQASPVTIGIVLAITGWPWSARTYRTQTHTLKNREFIQAAELMGESKWRIILVQIFPNMISLVASGFIGSTIYFILAEAGLEFIGLGDPASVTWGTMLYWGQKSSALSTGAWWEIIYPSAMFLITGTALILINFTIDEYTNPQLRSLKGMKRIKAFLKKNKINHSYE